jgi:1-acyl-sn-glycerol-3-phosphate acyltransferase
LSAASQLRAPASPLAAKAEHAITPAAKRPTKSHRLRRMHPSLRIVLTGLCFAIFFGGTACIGLAAGLYFAFSSVAPEKRWAFTTKINRRLATFAGLMRDLGLIDYWPPSIPEEYRGKGYLLVANHPTLIDVVLILASIPEVSCVAKASWYRSLFLGPFLRRTEFVPGPGHEQDAPDDDAPVVARLEEKLRQGIPVLVFPEGTRSLADELRRFRRGAIEAAVRANAPILPLFVGNDQPFLMKGVPFYRVPRETCGFTFEWLGPIENAGAYSSRELTRELSARYEARFAKLVAERSQAPARDEA